MSLRSKSVQGFSESSQDFFHEFKVFNRCRFFFSWPLFSFSHRTLFSFQKTSGFVKTHNCINLNSLFKIFNSDSFLLLWQKHYRKNSSHLRKRFKLLLQLISITKRNQWAEYNKINFNILAPWCQTYQGFIHISNLNRNDCNHFFSPQDFLVTDPKTQNLALCCRLSFQTIFISVLP